MIEDKDTEGFNPQAKVELKKSVDEFAKDLVREANRIETSMNTTAKGPEITSSIVYDAKILLRHKLSKPKIGILNKILKIAASVSCLLVGIMYQADKLKNSTGYMVFFIILITVAIILTTITFIKDN